MGTSFIVLCGLCTTPLTETGNKFILVTDNFKNLQGFFKIFEENMYFYYQYYANECCQKLTLKAVNF